MAEPVMPLSRMPPVTVVVDGGLVWAYFDARDMHARNGYERTHGFEPKAYARFAAGVRVGAAESQEEWLRLQDAAVARLLRAARATFRVLELDKYDEAACPELFCRLGPGESVALLAEVPPNG